MTIAIAIWKTRMVRHLGVGRLGQVSGHSSILIEWIIFDMVRLSLCKKVAENLMMEAGLKIVGYCQCASSVFEGIYAVGLWWLSKMMMKKETRCREGKQDRMGLEPSS